MKLILPNASILTFQLLANVYQSQGLLQGSDGASTTIASTGGTTSVAISDIDKSGAFSLSTTQSPVLLHSSPFNSNPSSDLERMALRQELEETKCKLNAVRRPHIVGSAI